MAKTIFYSLAALVRKILFCHAKIKFISSRHCLISSIYMLAKKFANGLFKKIEIFARPYRANVRMGNGHEMFLTLMMTSTQVVEMSVT